MELPPEIVALDERDLTPVVARLFRLGRKIAFVLERAKELERLL